MLVCRRMKYDIRSIFGKNAVQSCPVTHGSYLNREIKRLSVFADKLLLNIVCVVFIDIEDNQFFRLQLRYLASYLTAYGASASRYKHGFSGIDIRYMCFFYIN